MTKRDGERVAEWKLCILIAALGAVLSGCGKNGYSELGLVEVDGKVTLDGKPLAGAKVAFEGEDKGASLGTTDSAGHYVLMYDSTTKGVKPGPKVVRITTANTEVEGGGVAEGAKAAAEAISAKYNRQSTLKADVSASSKTFNFDLKSGP